MSSEEYSSLSDPIRRRRRSRKRVILRLPPVTVLAAVLMTLPFAPPAILAQAFDSLLNIGAAVLGITVLIVLHEAGHFFAARWFGVRCDVFSVGFGPRLVGFKRGDTDYRISAIPVGGYVSMAGENPEDDPTGADDEFSSKSVGARGVILSAGVIMNILLAVFLFVFAFAIGVRFVVPIVGSVSPGGPAHGLLQPGDKIISVNGKSIIDFHDISVAAALSDPEDGLEVVLQREGEAEPRTVMLKARRGDGDNFPQLLVQAIEIVAEVEPDDAGARAAILSPRLAAAAGLPPPAALPIGVGLQKGDRILGLADDPNASTVAVFRALRESPGQPVRVVIERPLGEPGDDPYEPLIALVIPETKPVKSIGIVLGDTPRVQSVIEGTAASEAGFQPGDRIVSIGGEPAGHSTLRDQVQKTGGKPTPVVVERRKDGELERVTLTVTPREVPAGFQLGVQYHAPYVAEVVPGTPAAEAGLQPGDRIEHLAVGRKLWFFNRWEEVDHQQALEALLRTVPEGPFDLIYVRDGKQVTTQVAKVEDHATQAWGDVGVAVTEERFTKQVGVFQAVGLGLNRTVVMTERILLMIRGLVTAQVSARELGGPVQIVYVSYRLAQRGIGTLIYFLALLSVNLAVINILPIPALDGGHLMFLLIEKLRGSPAPASVLTIAQLVGVALLLLLMLYVFANDVMRLLG